MGRNDHYWSKADQMKAKAAVHTKEMEARFGLEIRTCIAKTWTYDDSSFISEQVPTSGLLLFNSNIKVVATDTVSAAFDFSTGKTAVLNFASYTNAGGHFINGSIAQEECLCHASFLYNVLKEKTEYYKTNNTMKKRALYTNRALYSPAVRFFKDDKTKLIDVITCASPNFTAAEKYCAVTREVNREVLKSRIEFVLNIAKREKVNNLILGAYGCGVFGQDPTEVSQLFKEILGNGNYHFANVIFAIPGGKNLEEFEKTFNICTENTELNETLSEVKEQLTAEVDDEKGGTYKCLLS